MSEKAKSEYAKKLRDVRWQQLRLRIMERDGWKCRWCDAAEGVTLNVHHKTYVWGNDPWDYPDANFLTLCEDCHAEDHATRSAAEARLRDALRMAEVPPGCVEQLATYIEEECARPVPNPYFYMSWALVNRDRIREMVQKESEEWAAWMRETGQPLPF